MGQNISLTLKTFLSLTGLCLLVLLYSCTAQKAVVGNNIGDIAPEITAISKEGEVIKLSSHRGKYVLVEFWESGNNTSRKNHLEMDRIYRKHKNSTFKKSTGLEIFSVSSDSDMEKWKSALLEDFVSWPLHAIDTNGWNSKHLFDFEVASLPKYYLLNEEGVILNHNIIISDLEDIIDKYIEQ